MKTYKCTLDSWARNIPWFILILVVTSAMRLGYVIHHQVMDRILLADVLAPAILLTVYIVCYLLKPISISVGNAFITINRKIFPVTINLPGIKSVTPLPDMRFAIRTFGNGGIFGYTGKYYKKGIGAMAWYCTQRENYILIERTNGKKIVITPDDPDAFMQDLSTPHQPLVASENN